MRAVVADVMTEEVFAVRAETSLATVARVLSEQRISGLPVIDEDNRPIGVISKTDLLDPDRPRSGRVGRTLYYRFADGGVEEIGDQSSINDGIVAHLMSPFVLSVSPDTPLEDAIRLMVVEDVHRLVVCDEKRRLVGLVTAMDVLRAMVAALATDEPRDAREW
jgi:CBS domain-containing protein